ncbi:BREX system Lon protease-like protein BrxL [Cetobacterium sp.]|uniref:BREX system Lon protease-like protein BrxL n=1 Tax=Cetobacterium sp. TaxID=2071632 RepID=UPI003EE7D451
MNIINPKLSIREAQNNNLSYLETQNNISNSIDKNNILDTFKEFYKDKDITQRFKWILNSIGISSTENNIYTIMTELTKLLPFIQPNYNLFLIGESGLGKSSTFSLVLPFAKIVTGMPTEAALRGSERKNDNNSEPPLLESDVLALEEVADCTNTTNSIPLLKNTLSSFKYLKNNKEETRTNCSLIITSNEYIEKRSYKCFSKTLHKPLPLGIQDFAFLNRFNGTLPHYDSLFFSRKYSNSDVGIHCYQLHILFKKLKSLTNTTYYSTINKEFSTRETSNINSTVNGFVKLFYLDNEPEEHFLDFIIEWAKYILSLNISTEKTYYPFTSKSLNFISTFFFNSKKNDLEYICFLSKSRLIFKFKNNDSPTNTKIIALDGFGVQENNFDLNFIKQNSLYRDFLINLYKEKNFILSLQIDGEIASSKKFKSNGTLIDFDSNQNFNDLLLDYIELYAQRNNLFNETYSFKGIPSFYEKIIENKAIEFFNLPSSTYLSKSCYILNNNNFKFINYNKIFNK